MDLSEQIYRGGFHSVMKHRDNKRIPYTDPQAYLPAVDCDFDALEVAVVTAPQGDTSELNDLALRDVEYRAEFQGQSQLFYIHAMLIANLRRDNAAPETAALFHRLWAEKGRLLAEALPMRWRISAATTFADWGVTMEQRSLGMGLSVLFDMIKFVESERRFVGQAGDTPLVRSDGADQISIAFDMQPYSFHRGDLDRNMLARLWDLAEGERVMFPLAKAMLFALMMDKRTIFARAQAFKDGQGRR
ncbi:hypothetical protein FHS72_001376 [Loktanella ponticola]|uniref:Uncharacterized protein n=1 Tax=Yoonia ponticola TaxID=1524255 RepID=A0A7W9EXL7_9RHOB|nr:hypothetical protein [Yoonia ponticola]MBB5721764.1 hypothetical protein [Yoonia ponticola]